MTTKDISLDNYFIKDNALLKVTSLSGTKVNSTVNPSDLESITTTAEALLAIGFVYDTAWGFYRCPFAHYIAINRTMDGIYLGDYIKLAMKPVDGIQGLVKNITGQSLVVDEEALRDAALGHDLAPPVVSLVNKTSTSFEVSWPAVAHAVGYKVSIDDGVNYGTAQESLTFEKIDAVAATEYPIKVIAVSSDTDIYRDSYPSDTLTVLTLQPLTAPANLASVTTADTKFVVDWDAVTNAVGYKVSTDDGVTYGDTQVETEFTKEDAIAETLYLVKVIAIADTESDYEDSAASAALEVQTIATIPLDAPVPVLNSESSTSFEVSWPAVANATGYQVSIDDGVSYLDPQVGTTYIKEDCTPSTLYNIVVKSIATQGTGFSDSVASATLPVTTLTPLAAPVLEVGTITATSFAFSWPAVTNAIGYQISIDDGVTYGETQVELTFEKLDATAATQYNAKVIAIAASESAYENSPASSALEILTLSE